MENETILTILAWIVCVAFGILVSGISFLVENKKNLILFSILAIVSFTSQAKAQDHAVFCPRNDNVRIVYDYLMDVANDTVLEGDNIEDIDQIVDLPTDTHNCKKSEYKNANLNLMYSGFDVVAYYNDLQCKEILFLALNADPNHPTISKSMIAWYVIEIQHAINRLYKKGE